MPEVEILEAYPGLAEEEIKSLETGVGYSLPIQYRNFLSQYNGGYPEPRGFTIQEALDDSSSVAIFNCLKNGELEDFFYTKRVFKDRIPEEFLSIAHDFGGNQIIMGVKGDYYGKIYFWDYEEEGDEEITYDNIYLIDNSFNEFLDGLHSDEDD